MTWKIAVWYLSRVPDAIIEIVVILSLKRTMKYIHQVISLFISSKTSQ